MIKTGCHLKLLQNGMLDNPIDAIYIHEFVIPENALDQNGHVNNVVYVQWMQDVAILHSESTGGTQAMLSTGGTWFVRSHNIEYLTPAFAADRVILQTWVVDFRRARSLRRYRFIRKNDNVLLAKGETEWVFVDIKSGRPRMIPCEVKGTFKLFSNDDEL
jgi:acyl-CoA thioester hydrolase